jgi:hypothetical protein
VLLLNNICNVANAGERTAQEYLDEANVSFDVQKIEGRETFKQQILDSMFATFAGRQTGNFNLQRLADGLVQLTYNNSLNLRIGQNGDIIIPEGDHDWTQFEKVGIRTSGTLEKRGNQAFSSITTCANAFYNFGALKTTYSSQLYNNYLFNSGVIQLNDASKGFAVTRGAAPTRVVRPEFKDHVVRNYGTFIGWEITG